MPQRRANDAQVERLLHALKTDLAYRQQVARRIAEKNNIAYKSAMRRLQRYVTEAGEKRSFTRAPVAYRRELRQEFRQAPPTRSRIVEPEPGRREVYYEPGERYRDFTEDEEEEGEVEDEFDLQDVHLNDLRAIISYHDGDLKETAKALGLSRRGERLLDFQVNADSADTQANVLNMTGGGEIQDAIRDFLNSADNETVQQLQDFADIFFNRPDWQIGVMLEDLRRGGTTFADWFDAWEDDGFDSQVEDSEYWRVWRAAYARATA